MALKFQIFVSSTFEDLKDEREQVIKAILEMGHIPVGMEMFSAADDEQWSIIARQIDEADYYAVIVGHRYGSVTATGISYTEKEYDYAASTGVPVLGFLIDEKAAWPADRVETDHAKRVRLDQFRSKVRARMVNFWSNKNDLHAKFSIALMKAFTTTPRTGWTRASDVAGPEVTRELTRLSSENSTLRAELASLKRQEAEQDKSKLREVFITLGKTPVEAFVRQKPDDWGNEIQTTLLEIFSAIAPKLLVERTTKSMAGDIALHIGTGTHYSNWPVPENYLQDWLADLHALELVGPSPKKHSVNDSGEYWTLTSTGRDLLKDSRRIQLEQSKRPKTEHAPEAPSDG